MDFLHRSALQASPQGKAPVLVFLHGVGANEKGLMALAENFDPRFEVYSLRAPLTLSEGSYAWFHVEFTSEGPRHHREEAELSRKSLVNFLESLKDQQNINPEKIFLVGFSQGAIMGLSVALTEPSLARGVVAIAGRTLQEISAQAKPADPASEVLLIHGKEDNKLPYFHGENSAAVLQKAKFPVIFKSYSAGHEITPEMIQDIQAWLLERI